MVKCTRIVRPVSCSSQPQPHFISGPPGRPRLINLQGPPSSLHVARGCRALRAYCEVRAHREPGEQAPQPQPPSASSRCKRARLRLAVSLEPQRQPHSIRRPGGSPPLTFGFLPRRSSCSEAACRSGHMVKCARNVEPSELGAATQPHFIRAPGGCPRLTCGFLPRRSMWSEAARRFGHIVCARKRRLRRTSNSNTERHTDGARVTEFGRVLRAWAATLGIHPPTSPSSQDW
jgi:hypothetical protein